MPRYTIIATASAVIEFEIEAPSLEAAYDKAWDHEKCRAPKTSDGNCQFDIGAPHSIVAVPETKSQ